MPIPLELGQVSDVYARRALEQLALHTHPAMLPIVATLPTGGVDGQAVILSTDDGLYVYRAGVWRKA